ncbi:MAG TPA: glycoside hydrolase family 3 N-terminal domain-containing protein, partial [Xanthomonadaceae bacterium]|nr:glycoside hydrolase family 3 N-terminal domain-containing protein [Xanthomonadaceae bacterium]
MQHRLIALLVTATIAAAGCKRDAEPTPSPAVDQATQAAGEAALTDWPKVESAIKADPAIEARIKEILAGMSLRQKVGQMTQSEIKTTKPEDVRNYYLGSVLNGGGSWPAMNKHAAVADWAALADGYYDASMATDLKVKIPIIWGTDAVHGHSNVYGATIYPHNIGLGAAHDPA